MTTAGDLREEITFQKRGVLEDDYGNPLPGAGPWEDQFTTPARIQFLRGSETVIAARLQGTKVVAITIRAQPAAEPITTAWRAYDARKGMADATNPIRPFNIRVVELDERGAWVNILAEEGTPG